MTPEEKALLERTYKLTQDNNDMIRSLYRSNQINRAMKILYWVVIIGLSVGAYYLIDPYIQMMKDLTGGVSENFGGMKGAADFFSQFNQ